MAIIPLQINPDGSVLCLHQEAGHEATVPASKVQFPAGPNGQPDVRFLTIECSCGAVTLHPVGGGADPERVQHLFARKYLADTTHPVLTPLKTWEAAKGKAKELAEATDGPGRWRLDGVGEGG